MAAKNNSTSNDSTDLIKKKCYSLAKTKNLMIFFHKNNLDGFVWLLNLYTLKNDETLPTNFTGNLSGMQVE